MNKPLNGQFTISRYSSTETIRVTVYDVLSGCEVAEVELSAKDFAMALTGLGNVDCKFELHAKYAGMEYQHKSIEIPVPSTGRLSDEQAKELIAPFEVDGWFGWLSDLSNQHRRNKDRSYRVHFGRYVDPATGQPVG